MGDMIVGPAEVRYSHCAERERRHFQINVYKSYERSTILGTIEEVKEPPPQIKKRVIIPRNRGGRGGESSKTEAPAHTLKKSLHLTTGVCETPNLSKISKIDDQNIEDPRDSLKKSTFSDKGGGGSDSVWNEAPAHAIKKSPTQAVEGGGGDGSESQKEKDPEENSHIMIYNEQKFDL